MDKEIIKEDVVYEVPKISLSYVLEGTARKSYDFQRIKSTGENIYFGYYRTGHRISSHYFVWIPKEEVSHCYVYTSTVAFLKYLKKNNSGFRLERSLKKAYSMSLKFNISKEEDFDGFWEGDNKDSPNIISGRIKYKGEYIKINDFFFTILSEFKNICKDSRYEEMIDKNIETLRR